MAAFKCSFGDHPLPVFCDNTGEALGGVLRPGNAGANSATDHIAVTGPALAQMLNDARHGTPSLVRAPGARNAAWTCRSRSS